MPRVEDFEKFVFIVGAPRSGTTTMARMLQAHPEVRFPFVKEPHFFSQHDLRGLGEPELKSRVDNDYLEHFFSNADPDRTTGADGSVSYLYAPEQLEPVLKLWPNSRFVVGVRDPMSLLPSLHKRLLFTGDESLSRFEDAWAAVPDRAAGRRIPWSTIDPRWLRYDEAGRFATYVERLFDVVGKERCLVMVFDDLVRNPDEQHHKLIAFSGLQEVPAPEIKAERAGKAIRYPWLQQVLRRPPRALLPYFSSTRYRGRFKKGLWNSEEDKSDPKKPRSIRKRLLRWNKIPDEKQPIPVNVQRSIRTHYQEEVDRLGRLIDRDLSHWLKVVDSSA